MATIEKVRDLLERYFNAETTLNEEQIIRDYFKNDSIPDDLLIYKPLFNCFSEEIERLDLSGEKLDHNSEKLDHTVEEVSRKREGSPFVRRVSFKWMSLAAAASLAIFTYLIMPQKGDSLRLVIDGVNVNNKTLALGKADDQMNQINSMLGRYRKSSEQLESMSKMGDALSSLNSISRVMTQKEESNRLD
ncbi:MAG: hypothetical protein Q8R90_07330 [Bacteroidales bacterium]|jgi:hypothetical protein|nr:hypothetical protein [Bacteroidales bacterium]